MIHKRQAIVKRKNRLHWQKRVRDTLCIEIGKNANIFFNQLDKTKVNEYLFLYDFNLRNVVRLLAMGHVGVEEDLAFLERRIAVLQEQILELRSERDRLLEQNRQMQQERMETRVRFSELVENLNRLSTNTNRE